MSEGLITTLITAAVTLLVCLINNKSQMDKVVQAMDKNSELYMYRVEQLEKKVDKHNNVIERMYKVETKLEELEKEIHHDN